MTIFCWKKRKSIFAIGLVLLILLCFCFKNRINFYANENLSMYSSAYALTDGSTGRILVGKEENTAMANASTTKILTCILTLEKANIDDDVLVSSKAASQPKVHLGMKEKEIYPLKDLLYGLMLESYNDCAVAIAEHVGGSVEQFAKLMNEKAREIGCENTYFITPNGLDAEDDFSFHHSTAADLCKIMAYCTWESSMKEEFLSITQTRNYSASSNGKTYSFVNHNAFLNQMDGVLSGKTGFTNKAGYCYVAAMEVNGEKYCIALLACGWPNNKTYKWKDARSLFEYGMEQYDLKTITIKASNLQMPILGYATSAKFKELNQETNLCLYTQKKEYNLLMSEMDFIDTKIELDTKKTLPIKKEQKIGVCKIYLNDLLLDEIPILSRQNAYMWGWKDAIHTIFYQFLTFSL